MDVKYVNMSVFSCLAIFISLIFFSCMNNLRNKQKIGNVEFDISTITAADYSVEMPIEENFFNQWLNEHYNGPYGDSK